MADLLWTHQTLLAAYYEATGVSVEEMRSKLNVDKGVLAGWRKHQEYKDRVKTLKRVIQDKSIDLMVDHFVMSAMSMLMILEQKVKNLDVSEESLKDIVEAVKKLFGMVVEGRGVSAPKKVEHQYSGSVEHKYKLEGMGNIQDKLAQIEDEAEKAKAQKAIIGQAIDVISQVQAKYSDEDVEQV